MKRKTFKQILDAALEAYFEAGDWRDDGSADADYEHMHRRCRRARAAVLQAYRRRACR